MFIIFSKENLHNNKKYTISRSHCRNSINPKAWIRCMYTQQYESRQRGIITFLVFIVEEEEKEEEDIPDIPLHDIDAKEAQKEDNGRG